MSTSFTAASNSSGWETLYAGYRFETATSLMHVRHRVLNAALGSWVQRDPLGYTDDLNLTEYVLSSPLIFIDSLGQQIVVAPPGVNPKCFNICMALALTACIAYGLNRGFRICFSVALLCELTPAPVIYAVGVVVVCLPIVTIITCKGCFLAANFVCQLIC